MLGDELFGVKDPAVLLDVLFLGLVPIEQRADAANSVSGNNNFTERLMSWDQDTCGQIGVFIIIILIFPWSLGETIAAVTIIIITFSAETQQAQSSLEFQYGLFQHTLEMLYR